MRRGQSQERQRCAYLGMFGGGKEQEEEQKKKLLWPEYKRWN